jgi:branched-subunit amino acid transport protein
VNPVVVLALVCVATWVLRVALVAIVPAAHLPARVQGALDDVAPAVLAALVVSSLAHGRGVLGLAPVEIVAVAAAAAVAWRTGSLALTVLAGVACAALLGLAL